MKQNEILALLPEVFRRTAEEDNPLTVLVELMEQLHAPSEVELEQLDAAFDPLRTRAAFLPMLAEWVDAGAPDTIHSAATRAMIADAAYIARRRGTKAAIVRRLEVATGVSGFELREPESRDFHLEVLVPPRAADQVARIDRIVRDEKPAYLTHTLVVAR